MKHYLNIIYKVAVIIISIFSIVAFNILLIYKSNSISENSISSSFLTAISIIVALGIGYSIVNVEHYSNKVEKLEARMNKALGEIPQKLDTHLNSVNRNLQKLSIGNRAAIAQAEINKRDMATASMFKDGLILQALKSETDTLCYIYNEYDCIASLFDSYAGSKRKYISNDILECINKIDLQYISHTKPGELTEIIKVLLRNIHELKYSPIHLKLNEYERERFVNIYLSIEELVTKIMEKQFPLVIDYKLYERLKVYDEIVWGDKPDPS